MWKIDDVMTADTRTSMTAEKGKKGDFFKLHSLVLDYL